MITFKEPEPVKPSAESQVEASAAPGEAMSDADLRKERMAKNFAPLQEPGTPKKSGGSDGRIKRAGRWAKANALLLAIIAVQGYTLAEVQDTKGYAKDARYKAAEASVNATTAVGTAQLAAKSAAMAESKASENGDLLINIQSGLRYSRYSVQCSNY